LNTLPPYRYHHLPAPKLLRDARQDRGAEIDPTQVYFVGFKIAAKSGDRYHHAMIIADDFNQLLDGIAGEYNAILDQSLVIFAYDITVIFLRNLLMLDPELINATERQNIDTEIEEALARRDDDEFVVYGLIAQKKVCLMRATARDGLLAIGMTQKIIGPELARDFIPLELCQAHPVRFDFEEKFKEETNRYRALMEDQDAKTTYRH
jgi:hypothetical protein